MNESIAIWRSNARLDELNIIGKNTMGEFIGIQFTEMGKDFLAATMPHSPKTQQPYGFIHGGANVVLAETLGSVASYLIADPTKFNCVGVEINASHLRSVTKGKVTGICKPIRLGRTLHVWQIDISNDKGQLTCVARLTVAIVPKQNA